MLAGECCWKITLSWMAVRTVQMPPRETHGIVLLMHWLSKENRWVASHVGKFCYDFCVVESEGYLLNSQYPAIWPYCEALESSERTHTVSSSKGFSSPQFSQCLLCYTNNCRQNFFSADCFVFQRRRASIAVFRVLGSPDFTKTSNTSLTFGVCSESFIVINKCIVQTHVTVKT